MKLNKQGKLEFFQSRKRQGDTARLAKSTGLTTRFINYVVRGERNVNQQLADEMYRISFRRKSNFNLMLQS